MQLGETSSKLGSGVSKSCQHVVRERTVIKQKYAPPLCFVICSAMHEGGKKYALIGCHASCWTRNIGSLKFYMTNS